MTESCGVYGGGLTFDEMRFVFNYQALRGVNIYNLCSFPYAREGFMMTGVLPFYTEKHACYQDLPEFNAYMERLSYVASLGQIDHNVALYMPIWDIWAGENSEVYDEMFDETAKKMELFSSTGKAGSDGLTVEAITKLVAAEVAKYLK